MSIWAGMLWTEREQSNPGCCPKALGSSSPRWPLAGYHSWTGLGATIGQLGMRALFGLLGTRVGSLSKNSLFCCCCFQMVREKKSKRPLIFQAHEHCMRCFSIHSRSCWDGACSLVCPLSRFVLSRHQRALTHTADAPRCSLSPLPPGSTATPVHGHLLTPELPRRRPGPTVSHDHMALGPAYE